MRGKGLNFLQLLLTTLTLHFVREVLCSCLHDARVKRANKTSIFRLGEMGARCAARMPFLCYFTKKWRKKGNQRAECPLETRIAKTVSLSLHSFFREDEQFQLLRLQVKETCKHGSVTQRAFAKTFCSRFPHPMLAKFFYFLRLPLVFTLRREM